MVLPASFLPGPVAIPSKVREAFHRPALSHRGQEFLAYLRALRERLCALVNAPQCAVLMGSGTLANDVVAGQLSLMPGPGLVLSNGEFGERLVRHAEGFDLEFHRYRRDWGERFEPSELERLLDERRSTRWIWAVACETSTGMLNDQAALVEICERRGIALCLDCISTIGSIPVDLAGVHLASAVSGKGLGAYPGLSMVFSREPVEPAIGRLPRYLDLGMWMVPDVPFTHSSNLVAALAAAVDRFETDEPFVDIVEQAAWLRERLRELGLPILLPDELCSPAVTTMALPPGRSSLELGDSLAEAGFLLSYRSQYLIDRNWAQICLMGECLRPRLEPLVQALRDYRW